MTDTDAANRYEEVGAERLLKSLAETVRDLAGADGAVVVGGPTEMTAAAVQRLSKSLNGRVIEDASISFHTPIAELKRKTEAAATLLSERRQGQLLDQVIDLAGAGGRGALGRQDTQRALDGRRVEMLLLSRTLGRTDPEYADHCVGAALEQGAEVEELGGDAAVKLDRKGAGIGARLRFTV